MLTSKMIIDKARSEGRTRLTEMEATELLQQKGINVIDTKLASSKDEAISISRKLGFPVALKIASTDIMHKSDSGGVQLNLKTSRQVGQSYNSILQAIKQKHAGAKIQGILVQKMARPGVEVIIGVSRDAQFGHTIMFGLGGIFVEVLKDVSFRIVPLTRDDAREMVKEIKGYPILAGYRSQEPVNIQYLEELILKVSNLVENHPEIQSLDLNPIFAYSDSVVAVDIKVILEPGSSGS